MVVTKTLEKVSIAQLTQAFNLGFSDYQLSVEMDEQTLARSLRQNSFCPTCSVGLFAEETLVGFVFNGRRGQQAYDSGTAIIPSYRGKGYSTLLLEKSKEVLIQAGVTSWVLEVLSENTQVVELYKRNGFAESRKLNCYECEPSLLSSEEISTKVELCLQEYPHLLAGECMPSWQNATESIVEGSLPTWDITVEKQRVGTLSFNPTKGSIQQLFILDEYRGRGYAQSALKEAARLCTAKMMRFNNIDACYRPLNELLLKIGFICFTTQFEMFLRLGLEL